MPGYKLRSIVVVEDDQESRMTLGRLLDDLGYLVIEHRDAVSALAAIRGRDTVDLVITDERISGMSGIELAGAVRRERPDVPIIMVTAYGNVESYIQSLGLGVFEYLVKPVKKAELAVIVKAALHSGKREA